MSELLIVCLETAHRNYVVDMKYARLLNAMTDVTIVPCDEMTESGQGRPTLHPCKLAEHPPL